MPDNHDLKADLWWCHMFRSIVTSGDLRDLSGAAIKVYFVLKVSANLHTGEANVLQDRIAQLCGLSISSVKRGLGELKQKGYVKSKERFGQSSTYRMIERFPVITRDREVVATATFPFIGKDVKERTREVEETLKIGRLSDFSPTINIGIEITNQIVVTGSNITINGNVTNGYMPSTELPAKMSSILNKHLKRSGYIEKETEVFHNQLADDLAHE
jgi:DNA-binding transcriptional MocR family regulator